MEITVHNRNIRISPRKVRPVLHGLRGQVASSARDSLRFTNRKAAGFLYQLVKSGIAVGKENYIEADKLMIKAVFCNEAPRLMRSMAWSRGQSRRITKRASHITLVLESVEVTEKPRNTKDNETTKKADPKTAKSKETVKNAKMDK